MTVLDCLMQNPDDIGSAAVQSSFDSNFLDEFKAFESTLTPEANSNSLVYQSENPSSDHESVSESFSGSLDTVGPSKANPLVVEDPIVTYDSVVTQMVANGINWAPPDQNVNGTTSTAATKAIKVCNDNFNGDRISRISELSPSSSFSPEKPVKLRNPSTFTSNGSTPKVSENSAKVQELQSQLNQEKATRKQQDDYIHQLQRYYDNLLAKHAAAEMTIDQLRFRSKIGCGVDSGGASPMSRSGPSTLRNQKLISTSLDTRPHDGLLRNIEPQSCASLANLHDKPFVQLRNSNNSSMTSLQPMRKSAIQPQVHLLPLSAPLGQLMQCPSNESLVSSQPTLPKLDSAPSEHEFFEESEPAVGCNTPTQPAAMSLEGRFNTSLTEIFDRLNAIDAHISSSHRDDVLAAIQRDLSDLKRRYLAEQRLHSSDEPFDVETAIASRISLLSDRLQQMVSGHGTPTRPSSLKVTRDRCTLTTSVSSGYSGSENTRHEAPSSVVNPTNLNSIVGASSKDIAETHFARLLARYNKLKMIPGHGKDIESLIQRMLQLANRYSNQSSVIFPPKSLRRMFELDYSAHCSSTGPRDHDFSSSRPFLQNSSQSTASETVNEVSCKAVHVVTPDSGVPQTPSGSSGGSSASHSSQRGGLKRQDAALPAESRRQQSDSGFWATDSSLLPPCKSFSHSNTTELEEGDEEAEVATATNNTTNGMNGNGLMKLSSEAQALEADIQRLRQGIARLASTASVSAKSSTLQYRPNEAGSTLSGSVSERKPRRKTTQFSHLDATPNQVHLDHSLKRTSRSSSTVRQTRLPTASSSSSSEDVSYQECIRPNRRSKSRYYEPPNSSVPQLAVVGCGLNPQHRPATAGPTRTYNPKFLRKQRLQPRQVDDTSSSTTLSGFHRRSRSSTGPRIYYQACESCGGSGYSLNTIGKSEAEDIDPFAPLHSHSISRTPTIRLPVYPTSNGWAERVYGMRDLCDSVHSPQAWHAYNTIGHQPYKYYRPTGRAQLQRGLRQSPLLPAASSPLIPQKIKHSTRQYAEPPKFNYNSTPSSSEDEFSATLSASGFSNNRRILQTTELDDLSSASSAFGVGTCAGEATNRPNDKRACHQHRHRDSPDRRQPRRRTRSRRHEASSSNSAR
uniref:DNA helicase n=2 Tax=Mesocestoides corti TaxID=53468 RepID=A0A5K3ENT0_MESCO